MVIDRCLSMTSKRGGQIARWLGTGIGLAVGSLLTYVTFAWLRYGGAARPAHGAAADPLLDRFMPTYDVEERHHVRVGAPAETTLTVAQEMDLLRVPLVRWIFRTRELILGSKPDDQVRPRELLPFMRSLGWGILAQVPGREVVVGAVTKPWEANVVFRPVPADQFAAFHEPGWVKIAWTLRADPMGAGESVFRTETRVATTDGASRAAFRRYWALASAGIVLIRWLLLGPLKAEAERRMAHAAAGV
jgi:hypothetical protein